MPADAIIGAAGGVLGAGINYLTARHINKQNIAFQREENTANTRFAWDMYERQRRDALEDWWRNTPAQQMQRLREAGLNPHLVYGQGAQMTASMVRSSSGSPGNNKAPYSDPNILPSAINAGIGAMNSIWQGRQMQAQTDNLREQNKVLAQDALLKAAQTAATNTGNERSKYDLALQQDLRDLIIEQTKQNIRLTSAQADSTTAGIDLMFNKDEREQLKNTADIQKTMQDIIESKIRNVKTEADIHKIYEEIKNLDSSRTLTEAQVKQMVQQMNATLEALQLANYDKQLYIQIHEIEAKLAAMGLTPNSPEWMRQFMLMVSQLKN